MFFGYLLSGIRWKYLNREFTLSQSVNGAIVSKAANTITPMRGGDMVRAFYLSSVSGRKVPEVFGKIVIEGVTVMVAVLSLLLVSVFALGGIVREQAQHIIMIGIMACVCVYVFLYVCRKHRRLIDHYYQGINCNGKITKYVLERTYNFLISFNNISLCHMFYAQIMSFGVLYLGITAMYIFMTAVRIDVSFLSVIYIFPLITLSILLPLTVGHVGVYHAAMVIALNIVGINDSDIVGKVIMVHIFSTVPPTIYGFCLITMNSMRYSD